MMSETVKRIVIAFVALQLLAFPLMFLLDNKNSGAIILAVLAGGLLFFLGRKYGWRARLGAMRSVFQTMGNDAVARFTRREEGAAVVYDVIPARVSRGALFFYVGVITLACLFFPFVLPVWLLLGYLLMRGHFVDARYRRAVRLTIAAGRLTSDTGAVFALGDGGDMDVVQLYTVVAEPVAVGPGGQSTSGMVGRAIGRRQAERSYAVRIRVRGQSAPEVIAGGLTLDCAQALLADMKNDVAVRARPEQGCA